MKNFSKIALSSPLKVLFELAQHSNDVVIIADWGRTILYANPAACKKTGYTRKELAGQKVPILYRRENHAKYTAQIFRDLRRVGRWSGEIELRRKDGSAFWTETSLVAYHDDRGRPSGTLSISRDLTGEKLLTQHSMEEENRLQQVIESMADAVCVCDKKGKILMVNSAHSRMLGCRKDEIVGLALPYPWIDPAESDKTKFMFRQVAKEGSVKNVPLTWRRRDGRKLIVSIAMSRYTNQAHGVDGRVCTIRDISNVQYTEELQKANEQIQRLVFDVKQKSLRLRTLEETNALVLHQAGIDKIFREIVGGVKNLVEHDLAGIYVHDVEHESLIPHTLSKQTPFSRKLAKFPIKLGQGIVGEAALSGNMVWVNNAHLDPRSRYPEGMKPACEHFIAVPLRSNDTMFGVLVVARNRDPEFLEEETTVIKSFADAACVALENARLIHQLTKEQEKFSKTVFTDMSGPLNDARTGKFTPANGARSRTRESTNLL